MATLVFLSGYLVYIVCVIALRFLVSAAVPSLMGKLSSIMIPITFVFPLALKNFPWVVPTSESSIVSQVTAILLCLACYLVCTLLGLVVLNVGLLRPAPRKDRSEESPGYRHAIIGCVTFVVMDMFMTYSSMVVNDMQGVAVLVEKPSFTSQLLSNLPFGIEPTLFGSAVRMLATLLAIWALSFLVARALSVLAKTLLPLDPYPRSRFLVILVLTFMVLKYMVEKSAPISGMKATLLGLAVWISDYHVVYVVVRYVTFLALALLPQEVTTCGGGEYHKAAAFISLVLVLTMQPGPSTPIENAALICESTSAAATASTGRELDDFIRFSEEMMAAHKMAMEKIVAEFSLLIKESRQEMKSFVIHTILILMTLMGGMVFYVRENVTGWINSLTNKVPAWMKDPGSLMKLPGWKSLIAAQK